MIEDFKRTFFTGFGGLLLTKKKAREIIDKWVAESKMSEEDAKKLMEEMFETGQREADNIDSAISDKFKKSMDSLGVAKKDELKDIQERLELLEARVLILEKIKSGEQK